MEKAAQSLRMAYGARVILVRKKPLPMSSTELRALLPLRQGRDKLSEAVYAEIIRCRHYGAKPELSWLREKAYTLLKPSRVPHVAGCEREAVMLSSFFPPKTLLLLGDAMRTVMARADANANENLLLSAFSAELAALRKQTE
jgi:hypothetical protein